MPSSTGRTNQAYAPVKAATKAEQMIATGTRLRREGTEALSKRVSLDPAALEWIAELLGTYECAELGRLTISRHGGGYWAQFDEWGSEIGGEIQPGGDRLLLLVSPPWRGVMQLLVDVEGRRLVLDRGQQLYHFRRCD